MQIEFNIPDLGDAAKGVPQYWAKSLFIQTASDRYQINALTSTYIRLVEAAIIEYQFGAVKLKEFWDTHSSMNLSAMHRSISHFEACISNIYRATNCFRRLRRDREHDPIAKVLGEHRPAFAKDAFYDKFRLIRNDIHHLEEMVLEGRIAEGQSFALKPDGVEVDHPTNSGQTIKTINKLVIGGREVLFTELHQCLIEMMKFAEIIAEQLPASKRLSGASSY